MNLLIVYSPDLKKKFLDISSLASYEGMKRQAFQCDISKALKVLSKMGKSHGIIVEMPSGVPQEYEALYELLGQEGCMPIMIVGELSDHPVPFSNLTGLVWDPESYRALIQQVRRLKIP